MRGTERRREPRAAAGRKPGSCGCIHSVRMHTPLIDGLSYTTSTTTVPVSRSSTRAFRQNCHINIRARVALQPLVSVMSCLVACRSRISVDTQTDRHTERLP